MKNPLKVILEKRGLTPQKLAIASRVSVPTVYTTIRGVSPIPKKILDFLASLDVDTGKLVEEMEIWKEEQTQKILNDIRSKQNE